MLFTDLNQYIVLGALLVIGWLFGFASHPGGKKWRVLYQQESEAYAAYRHDADSQLRDSNRRIAELEREQAGLATQLAEAKAAVPVPPPAPVVVEAPAPAPAIDHETVEPAPATVEAAPPVPEPAHAPVEQVAAAPAPVADVTPTPEDTHHEAPAEPADHAPVAAAAAVSAFPADPVPPADPARPADPAPIAAEQAAPVAEEPKNGWFDQDRRDHLARIRGIDGYMQTKLEALGVASFSDVEKLSAEDEMALEQRLEVPAGYIAREQWRDQAALLRAGNDEEHRERFAQV